jgi:hypothetical protein
MGVRKDASIAVGGFPLAFGRMGKRLLSGCETEHWRLLWDHGGRIRYEPAAPVVHVIGPERTRLPWIARRALAQGRTSLLHALAVEPDARPRDRARLARSYLVGAKGPVRGAWRGWRAGDPSATVESVASAVSHVAAAGWSMVARPPVPNTLPFDVADREPAPAP